MKEAPWIETDFRRDSSLGLCRFCGSVEGGFFKTQNLTPCFIVVLEALLQVFVCGKGWTQSHAV